MLLGYPDRLSVAPGERIRFMVSTEAPSYEAGVVRLYQGDERPAGPGFREVPIQTSIQGTHQGRLQPIHAGSYVRVEDAPILQSLTSFTLFAWVFPTTPALTRPQGLISQWSETGPLGYALVLRDGALELWLGNGEKRTTFRANGPELRLREWYFVTATYDGQHGAALLTQELLGRPLVDEPRHISRTEASPDLFQPSGRPLLLAASECVDSATRYPAVRGLFNGKLEGPRIYGRAWSEEALSALDPDSGATSPDGLVAAWDLGVQASSRHVVDRATNALHGVAVNMPARAVPGHLWGGAHVDPAMAHQQLPAIHFHDDDLEDAGWEPDAELVVPDDLPSGVYAAKLTATDGEEYIPFFVRPARGQATARALFLAPTFTYAAYINERLFWKPEYLEMLAKLDREPGQPPARDQYLSEHPELGLSLYDVHADGSGNMYSSRLRPYINHLQPKYWQWRTTGSPRHFSADLYLVDWLDKKGFAHDIATDEDLHFEGIELLSHYQVVLTGTHPEYYSDAMRSALEAYLANGGRLMYLGGNGFYWVTSLDPERPHIIEVRRGNVGTRAWESAPGETLHSTTGEVGGLWRSRGKAPQALVGVGFISQGPNSAAGYVRCPDSFDPKAAFIFEGIGPDEVIGDFGLMMGGAAGDEIDCIDPALGTPPQTLLLATSAGRHTNAYQLVVEEMLITTPGAGGAETDRVRADMVLFETPNGGAVFSVGSINWCGSLPHNHYDNNVSRITENVLRQFLSE